MDSFFSLFDPSDSATNKPKKDRLRVSRKPDQSQDTARRKDQLCDSSNIPSQSGNTKSLFDQSEHCTRRKSSQSDELKNKFELHENTTRRKNDKDTERKLNISEELVKRKSDQIESKKKKQSKISSPRKNAHLPEESSFLCDPDISTDVLVKDTSYIDSFIDYNFETVHKVETKTIKDGTQTEQKNPKRRNSGRKSRQKKKISPAKDFIPKQCWNEENLFYPEYANLYKNNYSRHASEEKITNWNNKNRNFRQKTPDNLGKNVNDLQKEKSVEKDLDYGKKCKRKAEPFNLVGQADGDLTEWLNSPQSEDKGLNVIDKLEKASLQDELYLTGEFTDLDNDVFYSTDDEDTVEDSSSNMEEDSGDEVYGTLPPEPQLGNVEYKLKLANVSDKRFQHLVTQLKWRLRSGGGSAVYVVGVRDCGALRGLRARALRASLHTLRRMAAALRANVRHVTARRVAPHRAVAEVYIRKLADTQQSVELRVAVMGANEAGKSTLIGVLTQGELDNGRGSARLNMFRHVHEVRSGRTSSLSHEILGFDAQGCVVNYGCSELMTAERIEERSAKLVSFLDLAGHSKYQRTTVHGLTGYSPHYAMLVVSATAGINRMTEEHLGLLLALDLPFSVVVTKLDLAPGNMDLLLARIQQILDSAECKKRPLLITNEHLARTCAAPAEMPLLNKLDTGSTPAVGDITADIAEEVVPVFPVSCVTGRGLNSLHGYLLGLEPPLPPPSDTRPAPEEEACEFQIDEIFRVGESCGPVVGGLLAKGQLREGERLLIGPLDSGDFVPITVKTIYRNRVPCGTVRAGQSASLGLSHPPPNLRQGMVLVAIPEGYNLINDLGDIKHDNAENSQLQTEEFLDQNGNPNRRNDNSAIIVANSALGGEKTELGRGKCGENPSKKSKKDKWDVKNFKRKEKNVLKELANVENCLVKDTKDLKGNLYKSDSDSDETSSKLEVSGSEPIGSGLRLDESGSKLVSSDSDGSTCSCCEILLEDPNDPRGCLFFQATVRVLRHSTAIYPGFQATVHIGNIRQTAVIEGIMSSNSVLRSGESASVLFRFVRQPEYVRSGRKMLFRDGLETRGVGRLTQVFPYVPGH